MKPINNAIRQKKIISFSILLFVTGGVVFLLLSSLWQQDGKVEKLTIKKTEVGEQQNSKLVNYDELLHAWLNKIQQLDEQYASLLTYGGEAKSLDSLNIVIHQEEDYFTAAVERINQNIAAFKDESSRKQFINMIASFRSAIAYRSAITSLRNEVTFKNAGLGSYTGELQKLEEELDEKKNKISILENSVKVLRKAKAPVSSRVVKHNSSELKESIAKFEKRIAFLTSVNNDLKQTSEKLLKQESETNSMFRKNEQSLHGKANSLQQRINMLNAEIQLIRVDYNLLKMDAVAANSSSGQRKQLLSEASSILTDLSGNDNADIRKKAKEKVVMLNQIAAVRD